MVFVDDLGSPEGPVALPDGSWLVVEGRTDRGTVTHLSPDGSARRAIRKTGRPNGLAVDFRGAIWVAESMEPSLLRLSMDGTCDVIAAECDGEPFLFPNDLCFGPDGAIYMTDSGVFIDDLVIGSVIRPDYMRLTYDGRVYRIDPETGSVRKIDNGLLFANGIAFGPDNMLYVSETLTGDIYRYGWDDGTIRGPRVLFGNVIRADASAGWKGPDGMAFDERGRLYVAVFGQGDVTILGRDGSVLRRVPTLGMLPTNIAFALPGERRFHVTEYEHGRVEVFLAECDGLALWNGQENAEINHIRESSGGRPG